LNSDSIQDSLGMGDLQRLTLVPVSVVAVLLILPFAAMEYVFSGLSLLATVGALLRCDNRITALKFIAAHSTGSLLREKLPNSIAVRS
jgi:hypothetical protein